MRQVSGACTSAQLRNITLCSQLNEVHRSLMNLLPRLPAQAAANLRSPRSRSPLAPEATRDSALHAHAPTSDTVTLPQAPTRFAISCVAVLLQHPGTQTLCRLPRHTVAA